MNSKVKKFILGAIVGVACAIAFMLMSKKGFDAPSEAIPYILINLFIGITAGGLISLFSFKDKK